MIFLFLKKIDTLIVCLFLSIFLSCNTKHPIQKENGVICVKDSFTISGIEDIYDNFSIVYFNDTSFLSLSGRNMDLSYYSNKADKRKFIIQKHKIIDIDGWPCGIMLDSISKSIFTLSYNKKLYQFNYQLSLLNEFDLKNGLQQNDFDSISKPWSRKLSPIIKQNSLVTLPIELSENEANNVNLKPKNKFVSFNTSKKTTNNIVLNSFYKQPKSTINTFNPLNIYDHKEQNLICIYPCIDSLYICDIKTHQQTIIPLNNSDFKPCSDWSKEFFIKENSPQLMKFFKENFFYEAIFCLNNGKIIIFYSEPNINGGEKNKQVYTTTKGILVLNNDFTITHNYQLPDIYDDPQLSIKMPTGLALPLKINQNEYDGKTKYHLLSF